ncbi:hypothetical protein FE410_04135 [Leuconostoc carnosum]|uniref:NADPH-dependent F420 reductase n=1 Tax=Leuconostoc carnosum TaxID=1252 RepID=UPI00123C598A|nr:NAD(P)-binding domain-containing protein [Leuconostoc carnosum]KAA8370892.1 hypothetical protein FE414_04130 [Leuconostoc carnosum]KAA8382535.1 hypothetical protein FE410_04135 [Leuconostoc carnosum]
MTIAIIGAGNIGRAIATNLSKHGQQFLLANRTVSKAKHLADEIGDNATVVTVEEAIDQADTIILAIFFADEKQLIKKYQQQLAGKLVIDPSNPISFDAIGTMSRTLPDGVSAGSEIKKILLADTLYAKAFGSLDAKTLIAGGDYQDSQVILYFAADTSKAIDKVSELITNAGFAPKLVGTVDESALDIEVGGALHQMGGLNGAVPTLDSVK